MQARQLLEPAGGGWGLFGMSTVSDFHDVVVLTEGELDAMAVWQETSFPTLSVPNGCNSLPDEVLPILEDFRTIFLWLDSDSAGHKAVEVFARKVSACTFPLLCRVQIYDMGIDMSMVLHMHTLFFSPYKCTPRPLVVGFCISFCITRTS